MSGGGRLGALIGRVLRRRGDRDVAADAGQWARVREVLADALERPSMEREAFLAAACGGEPELLAEVRSLLAAHDGSGPLDRAPEALRQRMEQRLAPGAEVGPYRVLEHHGGGGMGVVYRAHDTRLDRTVALKFLPAHLSSDERAKQRFLLEAQSAAALDHPNICTIHEIAETDDGRLYITMPFYRGETLEARLVRGALPLPHAMDVAVQAARGLSQAHERGIVHRDIKPGNLVVTDDGIVKILDFGIAKTADAHLTSARMILGTAAYMSPEQAAGDVVDHRSDLWSLGVVLYEMISGRRPFSGDTVESLVAAILTAEPAPLTGGSRLSLAADHVLRTFLQKDPARRFATAADVVGALEDALAGRDPQPAPGALEPELPGGGVAPTGERRQIVVAVVRLTAYASLVEQLAPGEADALLARLRETADEIVKRHGGVVNELGNGEVVCLFGVPATHEDDGARAVRATLELRERTAAWLPKGASLQVGLGAGLSVVQPSRRGERRYAVAGAPLELASFLASHAAEGAVLLTPEAQRLAHPFFDTAPAPPVSVPDRAEPMIPHEVVGVSGHTTRLEAAGEVGLTAFSGRSSEMSALSAALGRARQGNGQMVTVMGEAGVGKSRLLHEFVQSLEDDVRVVRGRCPAQTNALPYHPFNEALRETLGIGATPAHELDADAVADLVLGLSPELEELIPLYLHLLGISSEGHRMPAHLRGGALSPAIREALSAVFTLTASVAPVALVLEDWHWADAGSHEALLQIAEVAPECALLVAVSYRPGHEVAWPEATGHATLRLGPLDVDAAVSVIGSVLGADELPRDFAATIHERAGGNPFFIEELCHTLAEQGLLLVVDGRVELRGSLDDLHLPGTVQGVIRTRLDRLDPDTKEVLRVAAVVGREFAVPVVERVLAGEGLSSEQALLRLTELGLVQRVRVVPDQLYRFKHVLTQQVAYDTLLQHQRRALHGQVGAAIEATWPNRGEQHAEALAHHFGRAGDWRKAVRYGREAAGRARRLSDFARASAILDRVEQWVGELHEDERGPALVEVLLEQERLCETLGLRGRQQELIARLILLLENAGDPGRLAEAYRRQGDLHTLLTRYDEADAVLAHALALDREVGNEVGERNTLTSLGLLCWHQGRNRDGLAYMEAALTIDMARGHPLDVADDLANVGPILKDLGEFERAAGALEESLEIAKEHGNPMTASHAMHNLANVYRMMGEPERALALVSRSVQVRHSSRLPLESSFTLTTLAHLQLDQGQIEEALATYRRAVEVGRRVGHADGLSQSLRFLGEVLAGLGRGEEGLPHLEEAAELFGRLANGHAEAAVRGRIARVHERGGRTGAAHTEWQRVHELSRGAESFGLELDACLGLARSAHHHDDLASARNVLDQGIALARRLRERIKEAELSNVAGILAWRSDAFGEALGHFEHALSLFREREHSAGVGLALNSLGVTLVRQGRVEEGRVRLEEALVHNRAAGERLLEGHALSALGDLHLGRGAYDVAERCFRESLSVRRDLGDRTGEGWMERRLAEVALAAGNGETAESRRARAVRIAEETNDDELLRACAAQAEPMTSSS